MPPSVWNTQSAAHLFRRAAYGATSSELSAAVRDGFDATIDRLVRYRTIPNDALDQRIASLILDPIRPFRNNVRIWLTRMIYTARPLEERMTFFWHNLFATNDMKVADPILARNQIDLFRRSALGNFRTLAKEVARDPAMLIWLDNWTSTREHPNENFGRELLELFTLGRGHYAESDVQAAARAFTGWTLNRTVTPNTFTYVDDMHDHGQKTFMGVTGDLDGNAVIDAITSNLDHARWIAGKLFAEFAYDNPDPALLDRLAHLYFDAGTEIEPLVIAILTSDEMYSPRAILTKVKSPVEHVVMSCRLLQNQDEVPALDYLRSQGQYPYEPPNVAGWPHGLAWITSMALLSRINFANEAIVDFDPLVFGVGSGPDQTVDNYLQRLGPMHIDSATRGELISYLAPGGSLPAGQALLTRLNGLAHMILSLPEWQMV
jgi:uncharacterized protein (DUF1800 family)